MRHQDDHVTNPPTMEHERGRAWRSDLDAARARYGRTEDCTVALWFVEAPWAHPLWHSYRISTVHLRPHADFPPAVIKREGATHELLVYALDPSYPRQPQIECNPAHLLYPQNFVAQFKALSDGAAAERTERAVEKVCKGLLSPDTDFRSQWIALFGDNMVGAQ